MEPYKASYDFIRIYVFIYRRNGRRNQIKLNEENNNHLIRKYKLFSFCHKVTDNKLNLSPMMRQLFSFPVLNIEILNALAIAVTIAFAQNRSALHDRIVLISLKAVTSNAALIGAGSFQAIWNC